MTKRLITFALLLVLVVSMASCAFALDRDGTLITPIAKGGTENGGYHDSSYYIGGGGRMPGGPATICSYSCFN